MSNPKYDRDIERTELLVRLSAARQRIALRNGLRGAAWSALAATGVVAIVEIAAFTRGVSPVAPGLAWRLAAAVLALGIGCTAVWVWHSRPDLIEMARRADRRFALDERLSTAVELGSRGADVDQASPVVAALFRDAAAQARQVDPRRLVPIAIPRPAIAAALVLTGMLALQLASPAGRTERPPDSSSFATAADRDPNVAADLILDIAALLREQAERESNDDLRVVATSLERLAADVFEQESGGDAAADELASLLAQADAASVAESDADTDGSPLTLANIEEFLQARADAVARADANTGELSNSDPLIAGEGTTPADVLARARSNLESLRSEPTGEQADSAALAGDPTAADSAAAEALDAEGSGAPPMNASVATGERPLANSNFGGGIADDSESSGGSPTDGLGGGSALAEAERVEVPDVASSRDFELPTEGGSRRRLPEEIVPQTRFTEVDESPLPQGDWQRTPQEQRSSGYVGVSYREVASRYFLSRIRLAEAEAESAEP